MGRAALLVLVAASPVSWGYAIAPSARPAAPRVRCVSPLRLPAIAACAPAKPGELRVRSFAPHPSEPINPLSGPRSSLEGRLCQLRALVAAQGHALVPADHRDKTLGRWAARQRSLRRQGALSAEGVRELDEVGFVWDLQRHAWFARFDELAAFHELTGHTAVPADHRESRELSSWAARQRLLHRQGRLDDERRDALLGLDFDFDPIRAAWERRLAQCGGGHSCLVARRGCVTS